MKVLNFPDQSEDIWEKVKKTVEDVSTNSLGPVRDVTLIVLYEDESFELIRQDVKRVNVNEYIGLLETIKHSLLNICSSYSDDEYSGD